MRGQTVEGIHKGAPGATRDANGNLIPDEDVPFTVPHCLLAPTGSSSSGSSETVDQFGTVAISRVQVIALDSTPDIRPTDTLTFWGVDWQIDGLVGPWVKGRLMGSVFMVKRSA